jgi:hypothetical protein
VFWIIGGAGTCLVLIAVGLVGAVIWVGADDAEWQRRHDAWDRGEDR